MRHLFGARTVKIMFTKFVTFLWAAFLWIIAGVIAVNPIPIFGQDRSEAEQQADIATTSISPEVQGKLQQLSSTLGLSGDQQEKIKPILQGELARLRSVKNDNSMSTEEKQKQAEKIHSYAQSEIQSILTTEQQQKFVKMREEFVQK